MNNALTLLELAAVDPNTWVMFNSRLDQGNIGGPVVHARCALSIVSNASAALRQDEWLEVVHSPRYRTCWHCGK